MVASTFGFFPSQVTQELIFRKAQDEYRDMGSAIRKLQFKEIRDGEPAPEGSIQEWLDKHGVPFLSKKRGGASPGMPPAPKNTDASLEEFHRLYQEYQKQKRGRQ